MITARLSVMMFLQFFIWGCWFVTLGTFLAANFQASGAQTGLAFSTQSWGAIIAPFIIGLIAAGLAAIPREVLEAAAILALDRACFDRRHLASLLGDRATYHPVRLVRSILRLRHSPFLEPDVVGHQGAQLAQPPQRLLETALDSGDRAIAEGGTLMREVGVNEEVVVGVDDAAVVEVAVEVPAEA